LLQDFIHTFHNFKRVSYIEHIAFTLCPAAIDIKVYGTTLRDEPPSHHVRFLTVATGR
jgi:hypothetical protein